MHVVIIGLGEVGRHLIRTLEWERADIVAIDIDPAVVMEVEEHHDVMTLIGYGAKESILKQAGAAKADLVIAVTDRDEVNLISALAARSMGAKQVIARVQEEDWAEESQGISHNLLGVDVVINPQVLLASEIAKITRSHGASEVIELANDRIEMVQMEIGDRHRLLHKPLAKMGLPKQTLIAAIVRNGELFVPGGADVLEPQDRIYLLGRTEKIEAAEDMFSTQREARSVCIVGGGVVGTALAQRLIAENAEVLIIEQDRSRAEEIGVALHGATVITGDGTDLNLLMEERVGEYDLFVAASREDEVNLMSALLAKRAGAKRTLSIVHRPDYMEIYKQLGVDLVLSPRIVASDHIQRYARQADVKSLSVLEHGQAEVLEFKLTQNCRAVGKPIHRLSVPRGALIAAIVKESATLIPSGDDIIEDGDTVIVLTTSGTRRAVTRLFRPKAL